MPRLIRTSDTDLEPNGPMKGILLGVILGAIVWIVIGGTIWAVLR